MIDDDFFLLCAREKHTIDLVVVRPINHKMRRAEGFSENYFCLVVAAKDNFVSVEAAAFAETCSDESSQIIVKFT